MPVYEISVPGRLCMFGEHSDWAAGYGKYPGHTIVVPTSQRIHSECGPLESGRLHVSSPLFEEPLDCELSDSALQEEARSGKRHSYVAGVAVHALKRYPVRIGGMYIDVKRTGLPVKKGLSSSAAVCVLAARAFSRCFGLGLDTGEEMELAYQGERETGSMCGRMDQVCAYDKPVSMHFFHDRYEIGTLKVGSDMHLAVVDLGKSKDTVRILRELNSSFMDGTGSDIDIKVRNYLGLINPQIAGNAIKALEEGDPEKVGRIMDEAQRNFDHYVAPKCPDELNAPALHCVLAYSPLRHHIFGGKGVGSQGDGSAQILAKSREDREKAMDIIQTDLGLSCLRLDVYRTS